MQKALTLRENTPQQCEIKVRSITWAQWKDIRSSVVGALNIDSAVELLSFLIGIYQSGKADVMFDIKDDDKKKGQGAPTVSEMDWQALGRQLPAGAGVLNGLYDQLTDIIVDGAVIDGYDAISKDPEIAEVLLIRNTAIGLTDWASIALLEKNFLVEMAPSLVKTFIPRQPVSLGGSDSKANSSGAGGEPQT